MLRDLDMYPVLPTSFEVTCLVSLRWCWWKYLKAGTVSFVCPWIPGPQHSAWFRKCSGVLLILPYFWRSSNRLDCFPSTADCDQNRKEWRTGDWERKAAAEATVPACLLYCLMQSMDWQGPGGNCTSHCPSPCHVLGTSLRAFTQKLFGCMVLCCQEEIKLHSVYGMQID